MIRLLLVCGLVVFSFATSTRAQTVVQAPGVRVTTGTVPPGVICRDGVCYRVTTAVAPAPQRVQYTCPQCGKLHVRQAPSAATPGVQPIRTAARATLPGQAVAQARANYMARNNYRSHPPSSVGGGFASVGGFEGVGWTSRRNAPKESIGTCRPSGPSGSHPDGSSELRGDAVAYGPGGSYRVRIWERSTGRQVGRRFRGFFRRR